MLKVKIHDFNQIYSELLDRPYCGVPAPYAVIAGAEEIIIVDKWGDYSIHSKSSRVISYFDREKYFIPIIYLLYRSTAIDDVELSIFIPKEVPDDTYHALLRSIQDIGLNPDDYKREI